MSRSEFKRRLPGCLALGLLALATTLWTLWGVGEMYYEGWWGAWYNRLPYLVPPVICVIFALVVLTWPRLGGWTILLLGGAFTAWRWFRQAQLGMLTWQWMLGWFPVSGVLVIVGLLFLWEGRYRRQRRREGWTPPRRWLCRNLRYVAALAPPLVTAVAVTIYFVPLLISRYDSGDRSAQRIEADEMTLVWAPDGPGWNWRPWGDEGRWLSWDDIALYGAPPLGIQVEPKGEDRGRHATEAEMEATGLCRYLSADGAMLMAEPQGVWRMPTTDEVVRSLVRRGESAGCTWDGASAEAECIRQPNKDTPLWAPDEAPIYYWTADEYNAESAWYVPYTGGLRYGGRIDHQPKQWGNARHGFRCVREPLDSAVGSQD
jgi:hypothetical protein